MNVGLTDFTLSRGFQLVSLSIGRSYTKLVKLLDLEEIYLSGKWRGRVVGIEIIKV